MRSLVMVSFLSSLFAVTVQTPSAAARRLDAAVDVCALRPDLCDDQPAAPRARRTATRPTRARGLDAETMSLSSVNRAPARAASRVARSISSITCRPSAVDVTAANQNLPECGRTGRSIASVNARQATLSFGSYMNQNAANPALSRKTISDYQTAFADTAKPATLDVTGLVDGSGVRENAPAAAAPTATSRNNQ